MPHLTCNSLSYCFRDICGQYFRFWGPKGDCVCVWDPYLPFYHRAKFNANQCQRRRDMISVTEQIERRKDRQIQLHFILDKTQTCIAFVGNITWYLKVETALCIQYVAAHYCSTGMLIVDCWWGCFICLSVGCSV